MRFSVAAIAGLAAGAAAAVQGSSSAAVQYTTEVVTSYETWCPEATTLTHESNTYTVTTVRDDFLLSEVHCVVDIVCRPFDKRRLHVG